MTRTANAASLPSLGGAVDISEFRQRTRRRKVALFLDVDGTLLDLAPTPDAVSVPAELKAALVRVEAMLGGALALVTGRTIEDVDGLFSPLRLRASGVHGAETRLDPSQPATRETTAGFLAPSLWRALNARLSEFPLLFIENKEYSFCVHYRMCPDVAARVRSMLKDMLATRAWGNVEIEDAYCAFELKPPTFDKGMAIRRFLSHAPFEGKLPVFVGDDLTDESGFAAVSALGGIAYSVAWLRPGATAYFETPSDVRDWLANFQTGDDQ